MGLNVSMEFQQIDNKLRGIMGRVTALGHDADCSWGREILNNGIFSTPGGLDRDGE